MMDTTTQSSQLRGASQLLGWARSLLGYTIPQKTLALFFDSVAVLLHTGVSLPQALLRSSLLGDPELRQVCEAVAFALDRGASLAAAFRPHAHRFPPLVLPLLEVGEMSGSLEAAARRLAHSFNAGAAVERRFKTDVFNPWLIILALGLLRGFQMINQPIFDILRAVASTLFTLAVWYLGGRLAVRGLMSWPWLRLQVDTVKVALPHMGTVIRNLAAARWARSFATLWGAGVAISPALEVSSRSALNAYYERAIQRAARETRHGRSLHESLGGTQLLPAYLLGIIATGEMSGNLGEGLERLAADLEDEAFHRASQEMMTMVVAGEVLLAVVAVAAVMR